MDAALRLCFKDTTTLLPCQHLSCSPLCQHPRCSSVSAAQYPSMPTPWPPCPAKTAHDHPSVRKRPPQTIAPPAPPRPQVLWADDWWQAKVSRPPPAAAAAAPARIGRLIPMKRGTRSSDRRVHEGSISVISNDAIRSDPAQPRGRCLSAGAAG